MKLILALFLFLPLLPIEALAARYAVATRPAPVFSTPEIAGLFGGSAGGELRLDRCGQLRELEFVALPGTVFTVEARIGGETSPVLRVTTRDYPYPARNGYFIDPRFVTETETRPPERQPHLPPRDQILATMLASVGSDYVWGGNVRRGIADMSAFYPPAAGRKVGALETLRRRLEGLDCSGLIYEATDGFTPRNTSALVTFGTGVKIAGLSADALAARLEPLDLIAWNGHVIIVLDRDRTIESRLDCGRKSGVVVTPLRERLAQVMKTRRPADAWPPDAAAGKTAFVVRRWYDASLP